MRNRKVKMVQDVYETGSMYVQKGIKLLDEKYPGWENEIDISKLQMMNHKNCIVGQLFGDYLRGLKILGFEDVWSGSPGLYSFAGNKNIWIQEILKKRTENISNEEILA